MTPLARGRLPLAVAAAVASSLVLAACTGGSGHTAGVSAGSSGGSDSPSTAPVSSKASRSPEPGPASADALQNAYVKLVNRVRPSVVQITTSSGLGSGVVFDDKGDVVTNDHVVAGSHRVEVQFVSGTRRAGTVIGTFGADDLAVVRVHGVSSKKLRPASFANSNHLAAGDIVLAIGNPLAYASSVTSGIISALGRTVVEPRSAQSPGGVIANAIQTSAPINPGNSGGALVDLADKVVGIPTLAAEDPQIGGAAVGIGFAIPSNTVTEIAKQLIAHGHVVNSHRAELGIYSYQATNGAGSPTGVAVAKLTSQSPAAKAGIRVGDVIVGVDHKAVKTVTELERVLAELKPGQRVPVAIVNPSGARTTLTVTLGTLFGSS